MDKKFMVVALMAALSTVGYAEVKMCIRDRLSILISLFQALPLNLQELQ